MSSRMHKPTLLVVVVVVAGCTNKLAPAIADGLPVAALVCPAAVEKGVEFVVDGTASDPGGAIATTTLTLDDQVVEALSSSFVVDRDAVVTVRLVVVDDELNTAEARCRIAVGDIGEETLAPDPDDDDDDDDLPVEAPRVPGVPVDLNGGFALVAWDFPELSGSLVMSPARQCAAAKTVAFVQVQQTGAHISLSAKTCALTMPTVATWLGPQRTTAPPALVAALPPLVAEFDLAFGEVGDRFTAVAAGQGQVVGAVAADDEELPTDAADPRVRDSDGDGQPGVTVASSSGDQQITHRRFVDAFDGVVVSNDEIDGSEAGSWLVNSESSLVGFSLVDFLVPSSRGQNSTFKMTRTAATSCAELLAGVDSLPAPAPPAMPADCPAP